MGAGSSGPAVGVSVNPRVHYADNRSRKKNQSVLIDAPVLVKLQHGTVRYRYKEDGEQNIQNRIELPHESQENLDKKQGYFYHSRLNQFGHEASADNENPLKFAYVYKGPGRAKQKQIYYVFGKGLKTDDRGFIEPHYKSQNGQSFSPTAMYKVHGHVYFDLHFMKQDMESEISDEEDADRLAADDMGPDIEPQITELTVNNTDKVETIKTRLGIRLIKPAPHIHIFYHGEELRSDQVLSALRSTAHGSWKRFSIMLRPK